MIEFEKIGDTFEDGFNKVKDFTKKNKVLTIAICGVGAFALYKLYTDKKVSEDTEYVSTYAYVPTAYDGYPTMSESVSFDDVVDQMRTETSDITDKFYNETMSDISQMIEDSRYENDKRFDAIVESMNDYDENLATLSYLEEQRERQLLIERMQSNSQAWHNASDSERDRLHQENVILGTFLGAEYDSATGTWSQDGMSLYDSVPIKNKTNTSTSDLTNVGVTETNKSRTEIIAEMKANSEAWKNASDTEKVVLHAKNQILGSSIGATYNSVKGTWTNASGGDLYSEKSNWAQTKKPNSSSGSSGSSKNVVTIHNGTGVTTVTSSSGGKSWNTVISGEGTAVVSK